ncbi:MAG: hypothetical protein DRR19_10405, partial [Candidatus Parabeggiatoa sp. nov. 1]
GSPCTPFHILPFFVQGSPCTPGTNPIFINLVCNTPLMRLPHLNQLIELCGNLVFFQIYDMNNNE